MIAVFISLLAVASFASAEESVVDCVTTEWEDSGSCSVTCGGGLQEQTRSVVTPAENGGACCGVLTQAISCNDEACPATATCSCTFRADNGVAEIYIDGIDASSSVTDWDQRHNWVVPKSISFACGETTVLAVKALDWNGHADGCAYGGFAMLCESTDTSSIWHGLKSGTHWKAWGGRCTDHSVGCPERTVGSGATTFVNEPANWFAADFDDSSWANADQGNGYTKSTCGGEVGCDICVRDSAGWLFRSPTGVAPSAASTSTEGADCALRESNDIFVKRAAMCGGEACVAIRNDEQRTAVAWGRVDMGTSGSFATVDLTNAAQITCGYWSCAVVKTDGSAQAWGKAYYNQGVDDLNLPSRRDITMVDCGHSACVALTSNGDALFWGGPAYMGDMAPGSSVEGENFVDAGCGGHACWAMKVDSSVMVWGMPEHGGNPPEGALTDVKKIQCGGGKCISITNQGRLYTWGSRGYGGLLEPNVGDAIIADAMCGPYVCIAFSDQGEVFTWGSWHQLEPTAPSTVTDVVSAHCGYGSCVALKNDGTAISWGQSNYMHGYSGPYTNVRETHCGGYLCIALKNDGSVVSWGLANQKAGYSALISNGDLSSDIVKVQCGIRACIAVRSDGTAFTWGDRTYGGNSGSVDLTNIALEFPCESSTSGRRMLESQQLDDYPVAEQYALRDRLLRL